MLLREAGEKYHGSGKISWGEQGGDGGAFNLAQNLLRHAVGDDAVDEHAFDFYTEVTSRLPAEFELTEAEIRDWVAQQEQPPDEQEKSAAISDEDTTESTISEADPDKQ